MRDICATLNQLDDGFASDCDGALELGSLAPHEVPISVKFENSLSRLWGEGGQGPGEGARTNGAVSLGGMR
ncbi:MAG: hypothetical protein L0387_39795, partial [Acidobacteria bacterium]|nr:hypothetical protein [Acidobacteriota bacterium]MCI0718170.1 hypothetical protein [Acidobacteriota bacterium]